MAGSFIYTLSHPKGYSFMLRYVTDNLPRNLVAEQQEKIKEITVVPLSRRGAKETQLRNPKELAAAEAEEKRCIHEHDPFVLPSCQLRGPTFIPRQGDPTKMPTLVRLRHRNRSCKNRVHLPHPIALPVIISREKKSTRKFPTPATPRTASLLSRESEVNGTAAAATQCTSAPTCVLSCRAATELPHKSSLSLLLFAACKEPRTDGGDDSQGSSARARQQRHAAVLRSESGTRR